MRSIIIILFTLLFTPALFAQHISLENTRKNYNVTGDVKQINEYETYTTIYPDGSTTTATGTKYTAYLFNTAGNLTEISKYEKYTSSDTAYQRKQSEIYTYDKTNKLIRVEIKDATGNVTTRYDLSYTTGRFFVKKYEAGILKTSEACTLNDKGKCTHRITMDASGKELYTVSYTYNATGLLIRMTEKEIAKPYEYYSYAYVYSTNGQLTKEIKYRVTTVEDDLSLEYDSLGQVIYWDHKAEGAMDIAATYTYDQHNNWLTKKRFSMLGRNMPVVSEPRLSYRRELFYYSQAQK